MDPSLVSESMQARIRDLVRQSGSAQKEAEHLLEKAKDVRHRWAKGLGRLSPGRARIPDA